MESSKQQGEPVLREHRRLSPLALAGLLLAVALLILALLFLARQSVGAQDTVMPTAGPNTVVYRYRFGGQIITHYLDGVIAVTEYRRPEAVDQVVFSLEDGRDYVLNSDILVDYYLPPNSAFEKRQVLNQLYNHYDPYLQAEKQQWHREWVDEQYMKYAGRLPDYDEWIAALNELTRGVEHHQMERWIQYSPPAVQHFVEGCFLATAGRQPALQETAPYIEQLINGAAYEEVEKGIYSSLR